MAAAPEISIEGESISPPSANVEEANNRSILIYILSLYQKNFFIFLN